MKLHRATIYRTLGAFPFAFFLLGLACGGEPASFGLVQTISLKGAPGRLDHMAVDNQHGRLFVANLSNNTLDIVDLKAGKLVKQIPDQKKIQGIAYAAD